MCYSFMNKPHTYNFLNKKKENHITPWFDDGPSVEILEENHDL